MQLRPLSHGADCGCDPLAQWRIYPLSRRMTGPCPLRSRRAQSVLHYGWLDVNGPTVLFTPNCHPVRWTEEERIPMCLFLADWIELDDGGGKLTPAAPWRRMEVPIRAT